MNPVLNITHDDLRIKVTEEIVFSFGGHKGQSVIDNAEYAGWILVADFPADTKTMIRQLLNITQ